MYPQSLPTPQVPTPQPMPAPHTSRLLHHVIIGIISLVLLGGSAAAGYFVRNSEVSNLQSKVDEQQTKISSLESQANPSSSSNGVLEGMQVRARDTERQTDVNSIATQIEVYFNDHAGYPSFAHMSDDTWVAANLIGIDLYALRGPTATSNSLQNTSTPDTNHYGYAPQNADGTACNKDVCNKFAIYYRLESTNKVVTKDSLN